VGYSSFVVASFQRME